MSRPKKDSEDTIEVPRRRRPATTPQARETLLIGLAYDVAENQLRSGSAPAQVVTHFLKLGTVREEIELEKLRKEQMLLDAKIDTIKSAAKVEELYAEAIKAMSRYQGNATQAEDEDSDIF
jgi:hypothetical protein